MPQSPTKLQAIVDDDLMNWDDEEPVVGADGASGDLITWDEVEEEIEDEDELVEEDAAAPATPFRRRSIALAATPILANRVGPPIFRADFDSDTDNDRIALFRHGLFELLLPLYAYLRMVQLLPVDGGGQ